MTDQMNQADKNLQENAKSLLRAMTDIDDHYLQSAADYGWKKTNHKVLRFSRFIGIAAAAAACLAVALVSSRIAGTRGSYEPALSSAPAFADGSTTAAEGATAAPDSADAGAAKEAAADSPDTADSQMLENSAADRAAESAPNPYQEVQSLTEAASITGFSLEIPAASAPYDHLIYNVVDGNMIDVSYVNADNTDTGINIRKAQGTNDISGDYNEYEDTETLDVHGTSVTLHGNGSSWSLATWTSGGFSYAVGVQNHPLSEDALLDLVAATE